ncbi:MAG TPA: hypothetical protein VE861_08730 [Gemmatimonadaceae bacterium]|nr:hypothetical protein [Gemmatimonadaceae bacterium]
MQKPISPAMHGALDYATSAAVAVAPHVFDFPQPATRLFSSLAASYTALSSVTDYPASLARVVPFRAHGAAEIAIGLALPFLPRALGFERHRAARNACYALAAVTFVVAALTQWDNRRERQLD